MIGIIFLINSTLLFNTTAITEDKPDYLVEEHAMELTSYSNNEVAAQLPLLQEWVEREFRQYPYLWSPEKTDSYFLEDVLLNEKNAQVVIVRKEEQVIGVAVGFPLNSPYSTLDPSLFQKAKEEDFDLSSIFYISYFLTAPEYHNESTLVSMIYNHLVQFASALGKKQLCYFQDISQKEHPLKPKQPISIEPWGCVIDGFKNMGVNTHISWPTVQSDFSIQDEEHEVEFLIKNI